MIQELDRKNEFALVSLIRDAIDGVGKAIAPSTAETYRVLFNRLNATDKLPEDAKSRNTYYLWRAAYVYGLATEARLVLTARDKAVFGSNAWSEAMDKLEKLKSGLDRYPPDQQRVHQASGSSSFTWTDVKKRCAPDAVSSVSAKSSKRVGLSALVKRAGWRDSLFAAISPNYADAAAIVLVAGVRPKEIQNGIQISVIDGNLCVTVKGAKVGKSRGQPERAILLAVDCAAAKHLAELAANGPITVTTKPKSLCEAFRRAGRRAFPRMRLSVSPYSARHALASDLKAAGVDPEGIAQVLGHCATRSQQAYGRGSIRGRSGFSVLGVRASLQAQHIDQSVITQMAFDFTSPEFVSRVTKLTRKKAVASGELAEIKNVQSQIASLNVKINRLMDLIPETTAVEVMLRTVESLEGERESLSKVLNELDREAEAGQLLSNITEKQVAKLLAGIAIDFESQDRESLKDLISNLVDKIEMDPEQLNCWIHYKIPTTTRRWDSVASPRGFEPRSPP